MDNDKQSLENRYIVLVETDEDSCEAWYSFLKCNGNDVNIDFLSKQLKTVDPSTLVEGLTVFDIDVKNTVSENTAKEMCLLEINSNTFHRKFDGKLERVDFFLTDDDDDEDRVVKIHELIGYGNISNFISDEDIPECNASYSSTGSEHESTGSEHDSTSSEHDSDDDLKILTDKIPSKLKL